MKTVKKKTHNGHARLCLLQLSSLVRPGVDTKYTKHWEGRSKHGSVQNVYSCVVLACVYCLITRPAVITRLPLDMYS